jgi:CheY-like chemotaxis protein
MSDISHPLVLIVDDNEAARYAKARILRSAAFEVIEAGTGADGLRLLAERRPSIAVLDVNLPDLSGWDVCRMIKENPGTATLPILQMSASYVTEADTVRAVLPVAGAGGSDGFSLLSRLRGADSEPLRRLPVIALTAYNSEADRRRVIAAGFDLHLAKPTDGAALAQGVAQLARQR